MRGRWWRRRRGKILLTLEAEEAITLLQLFTELRDVLDGPRSQPIVQRLFPKAYLDPTEEEREAEFEALAHSELMRTRLDRIDVLRDLLVEVAKAPKSEPRELDDDTVERWLAALNDVRLALGVALGISDDHDYSRVDRDDPNRGRFAQYYALTEFQGELVEAVLG